MSWKKVKLNSVAEIIAGQSPESKYYNQTGEGYPFFQGKADFTKDYPIVRYWCSQPTKIAKPFDILLSVRAPVGPTNICNIEACVGRGLAAIRVSDKLDYKYLYFYFKSIEEKLSSQGNGSTFSAITVSVVKDIEIPLPPLPTQKRIAEILDAADALRRKDEELLRKYDELADGIFVDMFASNKKSVKLNQITTKITDGVHAKPNYQDYGVPFLSVKNATKKFLDFENCKYISQSDHQAFFKRCNPEFEDILYTKVGATYGRAAIIDSEREFSIYVSLALIKPDRSKVYPLYLNFVLNSSLVKRQADRRIKGAGVPDLHLVEIKDFDIPLPSCQEQLEFSNIIDNMNKSVMRTKEQLLHSNNLFDSLLQQAFKGELVK